MIDIPLWTRLGQVADVVIMVSGVQVSVRNLTLISETLPAHCVGKSSQGLSCPGEIRCPGMVNVDFVYVNRKENYIVPIIKVLF